MDRCALFVDAGYVLADGAMAVHGTRRRESVSWDYAGLLQLLASLARERSGLPLLRCYWYEATVEGRRSADHDALADLPGVKLRLAKMRPGRREGVESEIHRDLTTLARNKAVSDAMVVSAEEDLAQVVADVQDLGMRVTLLHIAVDGNWTISRTLRQECDDIAEISSAHLRPYVELISGAEPPAPDERDGAPLVALRPMANGHGTVGRTAAYAPSPTAPGNGHQAPPSIYTAPVVAEYQRSSPQLSRPRPDERAAGNEDSQPGGPAAQDQRGRPDLQPVRRDAGPAPAQQEPPEAPADLTMAAPPDYLGAPPGLSAVAPEAGVVPPELAVVQPDPLPARQEAAPARYDPLAVPQDPPAVPPEQQPARQDYGMMADLTPRPEAPVRPDLGARPELYGAPVAVPPLAEEQPAEFPAARSRQLADLSGYSPGAVREQPHREPVTREPAAREQLPGEAAEILQPASATANSAQVRRLPTRGAGHPQSAPAPGHSPAGAPAVAQPTFSPSTTAQPTFGQPAGGQPPGGQPLMGQHAAPVMPIAPGAGYTTGRNGSYGGPRPGGPAGPGGPVGLAGQPSAPVNPASPLNPAGPQGLAGGPPAGSGPQPAAGPATPGTAAAPVGPSGGAAGPPSGPGQPGMASGPVGPAGQAGQGGPPGQPAYPAAQPGVSLADAVQSAHEEGQVFGETVARDAPALWLEAVLARKPRMPSDLEARLLQGSALPIDFLLHDEVRHALRRGFWDALERARR